MPHTIMFIQPGIKQESRTYTDYESVAECMEGVCKMYEEFLKRRNPNSPNISYSLDELFVFLDQLREISCFVYQQNNNTYEPYNREWIKERIFFQLQEQARLPGNSFRNHSLHNH